LAAADSATHWFLDHVGRAGAALWAAQDAQQMLAAPVPQMIWAATMQLGMGMGADAKNPATTLSGWSTQDAGEDGGDGGKDGMGCGSVISSHVGRAALSWMPPSETRPSIVASAGVEDASGICVYHGQAALEMKQLIAMPSKGFTGVSRAQSTRWALREGCQTQSHV